MAGREDVLAAWELESQLATDNATHSFALPSVQEDRISSGCRSLHGPVVLPKTIPSVMSADAEPDSEHLRQLIAQTAGEAVSDLDNPRHARRSPAAWDITSRQWACGLFRWGATVAAVNFTAWTILNWSDAQLQRFPDPQLLAAGLNVFPVWGTCARLEYLLLLADVALLAGAASYFGATLLEGFAED
jgi:hypothetical protein